MQNLSRGEHGVDNVTVVRPVGEIDLLTAEDLWRLLREACANSPGQIVLDLEQVTFCDASGLRIIARTLRQLGDGPCRFTITRPSPMMRRMLKLSGLGFALTPAPPASFPS